MCRTACETYTDFVHEYPVAELGVLHQWSRVTTRFSRSGLRRLELIARQPHLAQRVKKFSYMVPFFYVEGLGLHLSLCPSITDKTYRTRESARPLSYAPRQPRSTRCQTLRTKGQRTEGHCENPRGCSRIKLGDIIVHCTPTCANTEGSGPGRRLAYLLHPQPC